MVQKTIYSIVFVLILYENVVATVPGFPMILIPGDAGSQVFAKLNKTSAPHYFCSKKTDDYFQLWLNLELLAPLILDCWVDNMNLIYDNKTRTTSNTPGVQLKIPEMGDTFSVEYLDTSKISVSTYYGNLVSEAVANWGYERNKSIRGVPYDFRKTPNEQKEFYDNLKTMIEQTYYANKNTKVIIVGHSMGNFVSLYLYHQQSQAWKNKFIKAHISISAPWGGVAKIFRMLASGYNMDHYRIFVNPLTLRTQQRSMPSTAWLAPIERLWPGSEKPIIKIKNGKNYSVANIQEFYKDINFEEGWEMYKDTRDLIQNFKAPGVEMHCIYGVGLPTPEQFIYNAKDFPDSQPEEVMGEGDGTVNVKSNSICAQWKHDQSQPVYTFQIEKWEHLEILRNKDVIDYVKKIAVGKYKKSKKNKFRD